MSMSSEERPGEVPLASIATRAMISRRSCLSRASMTFFEKKLMGISGTGWRERILEMYYFSKSSTSSVSSTQWETRDAAVRRPSVQASTQRSRSEWPSRLRPSEIMVPW